MIHDPDLPRFLWEEAYNTIVYIQNKCPHRVLGDETPEKAFIGVKQKVSHFHIFGCPVYIHMPVEKRTKLEPSSRKGLFVGYGETSEAYKVYVPKFRNIVVSKDVRFEEDYAYRRSHETISIIEDEEQEALKVEPESPMTSSSRQ